MRRLRASPSRKHRLTCLLPMALTALLGGSCSAPLPPVGFDETGESDPQSLFAAAFQAQQYGVALGIAERQLRDDPQDGEFLTYRGVALGRLGRHEEAVEMLRGADHARPRMAMDRMTLYLRAVSLYHERLYARSQEVLDQLARAFPRSYVGEQGQDLAMRIEERLGGGIERSNLNWYLEKAIEANAASRPALAIEYYEEYLLLSQRLDADHDPHRHDVELGLGAAYLDVGDARLAEEHLANVPPDHEGHRAGMLHALSLLAAGERSRAKSVLEAVARNAPDPSMRATAEEYLRLW